MRKQIFKYFAVTFLFVASVIATGAQQISRISSKCPATTSTFDEVSMAANGNIYYSPCAGFSSIFTGGVDFSGATVVGFSPLTTKGDIWGFSTVNARVPIGTNGQVLTADSTQPLGLKWGTTIGDLTATQALTLQVNEGGGYPIVIDSGAGTTTIGDVNDAGNGTTLTVDDGGNVIDASGGGGLLKTNTLMPAVAGGGNVGGVTLPYSSLIIGNAANNSAQLTGTFTGNRVVTFPNYSQTVTGANAVLTNGQLAIGSTGAVPTAANITAGNGISVTNGAGSITLATTGFSPLSSFLASNYTNATAGLTNTALSVPVTTGVTYRFTLNAYVADSVAAEGGQIDFGGGSATVTSGYIAGSNSVLITSTTTTPTTVFSNATITGTNMITISGFFNCTGTGTFIVRAAQVSHVTGTLTMNAGSNLILTRLN